MDNTYGIYQQGDQFIISKNYIIKEQKKKKYKNEEK